MLRFGNVIFCLSIVVSSSNILFNSACFGNDDFFQALPSDVRTQLFSWLGKDSLKALEKTSRACRNSAYAAERLNYNRARSKENTPMRLVKANDIKDPFAYAGNLLRVEDLEFSPEIHEGLTRAEAIQTCEAFGRGSRLPTSRDFRVLRRSMTVGNPPMYNHRLLVNSHPSALVWSATAERNGHPVRSSFNLGKIFYEGDANGESLEDKRGVVCVRPMDPAKEVLPKPLNLTLRSLSGLSYSITVDEEYTGSDLLLDLKDLMGLGNDSVLIVDHSVIYGQDPLAIYGLKDGDTVFLLQQSPAAAFGEYVGHSPHKSEALFRYNVEKAAKGKEL